MVAVPADRVVRRALGTGSMILVSWINVPDYLALD